MKIIVPIDETNRYRSVLNFIGRLKLPSVHIHFLHAIAPFVGYDGTFAAIAAINDSDLSNVERSEATNRMYSACKEATLMGLTSTWDITFGYPATVIETKADEFGADIIALAASTKNTFERLFGGSVALAVAENSGHNLLILRGDTDGDEKMSAIYATDHSAIAEDGLETFLNWHATGLAHVEVLTAYQTVDKEFVNAGRTSLISNAEITNAAKCVVCEKTQRVAGRFRQAGIDSHARCIKLAASDAIRETLASTGAQLLILAAEEHGFWKSVSGSTSIHEIATEPCSLLVLRPTKSKLPSEATSKEPVTANS